MNSQALEIIDISNDKILLCTTFWSFWRTQISFGRRITIEMEGGNKADGQENKKKLWNPGKEDILCHAHFPSMTTEPLNQMDEMTIHEVVLDQASSRTSSEQHNLETQCATAERGSV